MFILRVLLPILTIEDDSSLIRGMLLKNPSDWRIIEGPGQGYRSGRSAAW